MKSRWSDKESGGMDMGKGKEIRAERESLKRIYGKLYDQVLEILFRHDPIGINFEDNKDEYSPEVGTILPRLKEAGSPAELRRIIHEEFVRWFEADTAGPESKYNEIAREVWEARLTINLEADHGNSPKNKRR